MQRLGLYAAACLWVLTGLAYSAPSATSVVESHLNGGTIITAPAANLAPALQASVSENEKRAPDYVFAILAGGRADANTLSPSMVSTAITSLSTPKSSLLISQIIEVSVKATPDVVLKIVRAAVLASPDEAAPVIVRAAVSSIMNPNELADVSPETAKAYKEYKGYKDFKQVPDAAPDGLTPAEKIVQAALAANPNLNPGILTTAASQGLQILTSIPVDNDAHYAIWPPVLPLVSQ
ncbi:MAG: hypothetical protein WCH43_01675 [Verrucomicrobiota bacterium]